MILVVTLTVRRSELETFHAYERRAAAVMAGHGGRIERTVVCDDGGEHVREVHLVRFPSAEAFAAYRADGELVKAASLRDRAVVATEILVGVDGPDYAAM